MLLPGPGRARGTRAMDARGFRQQPAARPRLHARRVIANPRFCSTCGAATNPADSRSARPHTTTALPQSAPPLRHRPADGHQRPAPNHTGKPPPIPPEIAPSLSLMPSPPPRRLRRAPWGFGQSLPQQPAARAAPPPTTATHRHRYRPRSPRPIQTGPRNNGLSTVATPRDAPPPRRAALLGSAPSRLSTPPLSHHRHHLLCRRRRPLCRRGRHRSRRRYRLWPPPPMTPLAAATTSTTTTHSRGSRGTLPLPPTPRR